MVGTQGGILLLSDIMLDQLNGKYTLRQALYEAYEQGFKDGQRDGLPEVFGG